MPLVLDLAQIRACNAGLVGAKMGCILGPFVGSGHEFALFRPRGSNFFEAVFHHLTNLF